MVVSRVELAAALFAAATFGALLGMLMIGG